MVTIALAIHTVLHDILFHERERMAFVLHKILFSNCYDMTQRWHRCTFGVINNTRQDGYLVTSGVLGRYRLAAYQSAAAEHSVHQRNVLARSLGIQAGGFWNSHCGWLDCVLRDVVRGNSPVKTSTMRPQ